MREEVEQETEILGAASAALRTGTRQVMKDGTTIEVVEPPTSARIGLRFDWDSIVLLSGLPDGALPADIMDAARIQLGDVVQDFLDTLKADIEAEEDE